MENQEKQHKFYYIYKITRDDGSGRYYVGMHSTNNLKDEYFGSGTVLRHSIERHGKHKHIKEILEFVSNREEMKARERFIVNEEMLKDPLCMNIRLGGGGGFEAINLDKRNIYGNNGQIGFGGENLVVGRTSEVNSKRWHENRDTNLANILEAQKIGTIAATSDQAKETRKKKYIEIGHQKGQSNSQFGTYWVTNGSRPIKIRKEDLEGYLAIGYIRGRKF